MDKRDQRKSLAAKEAELEKNRNKGLNSSRRKVLKALATGGTVAGALALTGKWSKPVVDTVILPAHAQATNATTPTATTTTSGTCSPMLASAYYTVTRDSQAGTVSSVTIFGTVNPAVPGATIAMDFSVLYADHTSGYYNLSAATDTNGAYTATQNFTTADQVVEVGGPGVIGPCGDTKDAEPSGNNVT